MPLRAFAIWLFFQLVLVEKNNLRYISRFLMIVSNVSLKEEIKRDTTCSVMHGYSRISTTMEFNDSTDVTSFSSLKSQPFLVQMA